VIALKKPVGKKTEKNQIWEMHEPVRIDEIDPAGNFRNAG
jgi:hypothetical protein